MALEPLPRSPDSPDGVHYHKETFERAQQLLNQVATCSQEFYNQNRKEIFQAQRIVSRVRHGVTPTNNPETQPDTGVYEDDRHRVARENEPARRHALRVQWAKDNPNSVGRAQDGVSYRSDHNGDLIIEES